MTQICNLSLSPPLAINAWHRLCTIHCQISSFLFCWEEGESSRIDYWQGKLFGLISSPLASILIPKMTGVTEGIKVRTPT